MKGKILSNDSVQSVRIENACGVWQYSSHEIDSIAGWHRIKKLASGNFMKKGYYNYSYVGGLFGADALPVPVFVTVNGYHFDPHLYTGIGIGFEYYEFGVMPLFTDIRYVFGTEKLAPFLTMQAGYGFAVEKKTTNGWGGWGYYDQKQETIGGPMMAAAAGIMIRTSEHSAFSFSIGPRYQKLSYFDTIYWSENSERKVTTLYHRIAVSVGFTFL